MFSRLPMYHRIGAAAYKANLDNTIALCNLLGNPQERFKTIHVAGTNGKGSVSHMLASILQTAGYRTGLYTSPHLKDFRERIRVNGKKISQSYVCSFINKFKGDFEKINPSFFEMTVGMAFQYFEDQQVDIAVIEVGLGGRLDSTNIIHPLVSVITNVSFDHMELLGSSLNKIAAEKAGIIKPGIPVIIGETQKETCPVFRQKAKEVNTRIFFADQMFSFDHARITGKKRHHLVMNIHKGKEPFLTRLSSPLTGQYQLKNIITVMGACEVLNKSQFKVTPEQIRSGIRHVIRNTHLAGRWQIISRNPLTICDTGHNEGGIKEVLEQLGSLSYLNLHFVFGAVNDKAIDHILGMLPKAALYYFCRANIPRGLDVGELYKKATDAGLTGKPYNSVREALESARKNATPKDLVFIGGSTFIVAEVL